MRTQRLQGPLPSVRTKTPVRTDLRTEGAARIPRQGGLAAEPGGSRPGGNPQGQGGCGEQRGGRRAGGQEQLCPEPEAKDTLLSPRTAPCPQAMTQLGAGGWPQESSGPCQGEAGAGGGEETQALGLEEVATIRYQ